MKTALLIGGTGTISLAVVNALARTGDWRIAVLNRGKHAATLPEGVEILLADVADADRVRSLLGDRQFDAVVDFVALQPAAVATDIALFSGRVGQYVFISSASVYQKPVQSLPITESTPLRNPHWQYARDKIACEELLVRAYREKGFPTTIVRPSHTYRDNLPLAIRDGGNNWQTLLRIREGKPVIIPGDGTSLWTLTHADDFAAGFVGLLANPKAIGHAFHITSDDILTWNGIYGLVACAMGAELRALHVASDKIALTNPDLAGTLLGDKAHSVLFDNTKIRRFVPGFNPAIRFSDAVRGIVGRMLADPASQKPDPGFDAWCDRVVAMEGQGG